MKHFILFIVTLFFNRITVYNVEKNQTLIEVNAESKSVRSYQKLLSTYIEYFICVTFPCDFTILVSYLF